MRGDDDEIAALRPRGVDDRLIGDALLDLDRLAGDAAASAAWRRRRVFSRHGSHAALYWGGVLRHPCIGRERVKWRQDRQHRGLWRRSFGQGDAVPEGLAGEALRTVRRYQDVGIHGPLSSQRRGRPSLAAANGPAHCPAVSPCPRSSPAHATLPRKRFWRSPSLRRSRSAIFPIGFGLAPGLVQVIFGRAACLLSFGLSPCR